MGAAMPDDLRALTPQQLDALREQGLFKSERVGTVAERLLVNSDGADLDSLHIQDGDIHLSYLVQRLCRKNVSFGPSPPRPAA